ncbi:hypothetical protein GFS03_12035 [Sulfolobus sp. E5-1-F]|uniref:hypothetical protein n=1 Tax=Saccharolobus sp. E5-1-F TaxID=2663019 RepID=UPI0012953FB4|nr:hypothetical protein [Sulfolobus sp. E5-1-F]QGA55252.1 hypothetical protein GFS03_12035 [Sulfolobus sp. E5-1-F]
MDKKGLSNVISIIILIFIVLVVLVPILYYVQYSSQYNTVTQSIVNNYVYLKNLQISQVTTGHPSLYYNGSSIFVTYSNGTFVPPSNLTIVSILYLNSNGIWVNVTSIKYPLVISQGQLINLPSYTSGKPIIIVTSLGNIFFLQPGSSIGPFATAGKGGTEILAQIYTNNGPLSVSANVTSNIYGSFKNYTTPVAFGNQTGTFIVKAPQYVYYQNSKGQIITGVFYNWIKLGQATLNSTTSQGVKVTLQGQPLVLIANYSILTTTVNLQVNTNDPNVPIIVNIDGSNYTVKGSSTIQVTAGYINITIYTLQFNDTTQQNIGIIKYYIYSNSTYNKNTYIARSFIIFVPPSTSQTPTVYINYNNIYNYYHVYINGYNLPGSVCLILNNTVYNYNYNQGYWIIGGKYSFGPTEIFNGEYTFGAQTVKFKYSNGSTFTYTFPNIPSYVLINQPMTISVYYGETIQWYLL